MPPKKRTSSGSTKKSSIQNQNLQQQQQQSQPSKFGIQHFFERHTQNALSQKSKSLLVPHNSNSNPNPNPNPNPNSLQNPKESSSVSVSKTPRNILDLRCLDSNETNSVAQKGENGLNFNKFDEVNSVSQVKSNGNVVESDKVDVAERFKDKESSVSLKNNESGSPSQSTPTEIVVAAGSGEERNDAEVTPEFCKSVSLNKRFKFSPGMLIKQSQDDGGDEVTWRISPVNERLHAMSKQLPKMVKVLADSSRFNSLNIQECSLKKTPPETERKFEKWLCSPPPKALDKSLACSNTASMRNKNTDHTMDLWENNGNFNCQSKTEVINSQSPFQTPPSLTYGSDKPANVVDSNEVTDQFGSRQHKKALIELLDQVEDVISVEPQCEENIASHGHDGPAKPTAVLQKLAENFCSSDQRKESTIYFLVLEVSEKHEQVETSGPQCSFKVLRLLNEQGGEERVLQLRDEWCYSVVAPGDTIHVIGEFDSEGKCEINRGENFLIVHPDILVSGTRVAGSFSCSRRAVLDERLKFGEYSAAALIGTLLHQMFQAGLIRESPTKEFLEDYARVVLQKSLESLYACGVNENDTHKTLIEAIPKLLNWIRSFRYSEVSESPSIDFGSEDGAKKIKVSEVLDIEEMAWAPKYGLKGMIDASLQVNVKSNTNVPNEMIMPLEFKTGKATNGQATMEHNAQVMLYTLLMSERYSQHIGHGLLYYLHTDQTQGITVCRSDLVGLIMRRNELANDLLKASITQQLPPMLQSPNMCRGCRHLNVCTIYHKAYGGTTEGSGLGSVFDSLVSHLTNAHNNFLQKWDQLIDLEAKEVEVVKKQIWSSQSLKNDLYAPCLSSLVLDTSERATPANFGKGNQFTYHFVHRDWTSLGTHQQDRTALNSSIFPVKKFESSLRNGDYVVLSTEPSGKLIATGVVVDMSCSSISVSLSKRLRLPGSSRTSQAQDLHQQLWRIHKDEFMGSFAIMRFNLIQLFLQNEQSSHLRKMIVDLEVPRFDSGCQFSQDPAISYIWSEKNLNDDQRRAILKILTAKDYALILGMPGTGKTSTMVYAVKALLMRGSSILLTSYTNSAVDNLLLKLKFQGIDFIRIGRYEVVHEEVRENCLSMMDTHGLEEIKQRLEQSKVVAVTCLGITSPLLSNKRFDVCIMDEAGQTTLPVSLGPLTFASKFVLVGDHYQLPPLVQSAEAREYGMAVSLFCRLSEAHPQAICALQSQYRMCAAIMELSNALIYGNRLRCGSSEVENAKIKYTGLPSGPKWIKEAMNPNRPVVFINTDLLLAFETNDRKAVNNPVEANIIAEIVCRLLSRGILEEEIGIITPYNSQADLIRQAVSTSVEIHTIDKYQGRDKDCILLSFVRSSENPRNYISSLLGDWHRINVALTRAKKKLIMVGSCITLSTVPLLKLLIEKVEEQGGILSVSKKDIAHKPELRRCSNLR
ncbi:DNA replication ATP-dependent helicase/nuclease JHS1 [Solanum verrucosum]|uniref:DNA replication ATP-dependent helicase/nuclease JHS1 n=1 Tax=Solanum verrucosum TaxID=315347 RepID=UPI0020D08BA3|nr:DNA replication ATP-dependent helicase/nuclease JHS1 [Solanum verrucosum]